MTHFDLKEHRKDEATSNFFPNSESFILAASASAATSATYYLLPTTRTRLHKARSH